jgi:hypothetical protein
MMHGIFRAPCDFLHLRVANWYLKECYDKMRLELSRSIPPIGASGFHHDRTIEQLARAVLAAQMAPLARVTAFPRDMLDCAKQQPPVPQAGS